MAASEVSVKVSSEGRGQSMSSGCSEAHDVAQKTDCVEAEESLGFVTGSGNRKGAFLSRFPAVA